MKDINDFDALCSKLSILSLKRPETDRRQPMLRVPGSKLSCMRITGLTNSDSILRSISLGTLSKERAPHVSLAASKPSAAGMFKGAVHGECLSRGPCQMFIPKWTPALEGCRMVCSRSLSMVMCDMFWLEQRNRCGTGQRGSRVKQSCSSMAVEASLYEKRRRVQRSSALLLLHRATDSPKRSNVGPQSLLASGAEKSVRPVQLVLITFVLVA